MGASWGKSRGRKKVQRTTLPVGTASSGKETAEEALRGADDLWKSSFQGNVPAPWEQWWWDTRQNLSQALEDADLSDGKSMSRLHLRSAQMGGPNDAQFGGVFGRGGGGHSCAA